MKKKIPSFRWLIILLGLVAMSFSRDKVNYLDLMEEAEGYFAYEEFTEALPLYIRVLQKYPTNHYLQYKIGRCCLNIPFERQKSVAYLQKAREKAPLVVKKGQFKNDRVPVDVVFYLGDAYRVNNQPDKAIALYREFLTPADDKVFDTVLVNDAIASCQRALEMEKHPARVKITNAGNIINTRFSEINPVVSDDETVMIYAGLLQFYQAVYYTHRENGAWTAPENIITDLGVDGDCLPVCLSADGKELYFYRSMDFRGDIYVSNRVNGKWTQVRKLNDHINTRYWEPHACLSKDGRTLYFASNRPGGYGGLDIYKAERISGDDWGPAVNLGPEVNTRYNEDTPFLTDNDRRLFFSSFGHETMGGYDLFYSDRNASGGWQKPVNLGYPVNTTDDDLFFCPVQGGKAGYTYIFDAEGQGRYDICRVEIITPAPATEIIAETHPVKKTDQAGPTTSLSPSLEKKPSGAPEARQVEEPALSTARPASGKEKPSGTPAQDSVKNTPPHDTLRTANHPPKGQPATPGQNGRAATQGRKGVGLMLALVGGLLLLLLLIVRKKRRKNKQE